MRNILIISAHADDECFGMGGTLAKFAASKKYNINWLIATWIWEPKWSSEQIESRTAAVNQVRDALNINDCRVWNYKDNMLDTIPKNELQEALIEYLDFIKPSIIFTPSPWDFNFEHKLVYELVEMSTKSYYTEYVDEIIAYEIPSSTESTFKIEKRFPVNYYVNINSFLDDKIQLVHYYTTELYQHPHPRSVDYLSALAKVRGGEAGVRYAEGFHILKKIDR